MKGKFSCEMFPHYTPRVAVRIHMSLRQLCIEKMRIFKNNSGIWAVVFLC